VIQQIVDHWRVDLIHMPGIDFHRYLPPSGVPTLVTLHLPPSWYPPEIFHLERPKTWLHCVSAAQRRACPPSPLLLPEIENGVEIEKFNTQHAKRRFAVALGRVCPEKGFHLALDAATSADLPLLLGGEVFRYEAHEQYYREQIVPRLNGRHRFLGPVGFKRKRRLLGGARCLLAPSLAAETSSLAAMEALASGTPVIAFPSGALGQIVEHGRTGFLVNNEQEMGDAIRAAEELSPEVCRETARQRFSAQKMTEHYLEVYRKLISSQ
jgi:glycosyltransferase involved in cell wall biosynthesis